MSRIYVLFMFFVVVLLFAAGCEEGKEGKGRKQERSQTNKLMEDSMATVGLPAIKNFQEKKLAKMIFELRDQEKLPTYAYFLTRDGKLVFFGQCIGFGLPYSVQYTCPESRSGANYSLPQADPNGLYMPNGLSATWLMMLDKETGEVRPVYVEPEIVVSPFKLH